MYKGKGNTAAKPRRTRQQVSAECVALYVAESIAAKIAAGQAWDYRDYYPAPVAYEKIQMVNRNLEVMGVRI